MRRRILITSAIAAVLLVLAIPMVAGAQADRIDRHALRDAMMRLDNASVRFQDDLNWRPRGIVGLFVSVRDNNGIAEARDFRRAVTRLRNDSNNGRDLERSREEARLVLDRGVALGDVARRVNTDRLDADWREIRENLRTIADLYGMDMPDVR